MGIFGKESIADFIRELLVFRLETDPEAMRSGFGRRDATNLQFAQLMALPEATVTKIIEAVYANLSNPNVLHAIEQHRSRIGALKGPIPESIEDYILQRVELEHPGAISAVHVKQCIAASHNYFGSGPISGKALPSVERARRQQAEEDLYTTWDAIIERFVETSLSEDAFLQRIDGVYERLAPIIERRKQNQINAKFQRSLSHLDGDDD